ncbi:lysoplasmalogenase [Nostoc ellipsosporum NOK]|nr:lysoplasmalogenase [Nostoc ellipsosporum NOK]
MYKRIACLISVGALAANLFAIAWDYRVVEMISKPLIVAGLFAWLLLAVPASSRLRNLSLAALFFSWTGDVLLIFQTYKPVYFLSGLSSFLLAHIFYCIVFNKIRKETRTRLYYGWLLPSLLFYSGIMYLLNDSLGEMIWPVRIYGLVITIMLFLALQLWRSPVARAGQWIVAGALLFVTSDSLLAINKFYRPLSFAGISIMLTYGLAQWCLISGISGWLNRWNNR